MNDIYIYIYIYIKYKICVLGEIYTFLDESYAFLGEHMRLLVKLGTQGYLLYHMEGVARLKKSTCSKWARLCRYGNPCPVPHPF